MRYPVFPAALAAALLLSACNVDLAPLTVGDPSVTLTSTDCLNDSTCLDEIVCFYDRGTEGHFKGKEGINIFYKVFTQPAPAPAILISSGRTEAAVKYRELIFDLYRNGYAVYIHDHRGQGESGRMADDPEMGHIDDFQYYVDDMKHFFEDVVSRGGHEKIYLLAHSMGGCIGMSYLEQFPDDFTAAAFSSPMLGLNPPICALAGLLGGKMPKYAIGQEGYKLDREPFEENGLTYSEDRYNLMIEAYDETPAARLGGPSYPWLIESCRHMKQVQKRSSNIQTPILVFSASDEVVVNPKANIRFVEKALKAGVDAHLFGVDHAMHELLMEQDTQRNAVISATLDFFTQY